jgi:hypothetical protein
MDVLRRDPVGFGDHLVERVAQDDLAALFPCLAGDSRRRQDLEQALDLALRVLRQLLGVGDQDGR